MLVYIAGKLETELERRQLEEVAALCESLGLKTFLPHRDVGLAESIKDVKSIFRGDITDSLANCDIVLAVLDGLHVGAGTAWELGYAYAKGIPAVGFKSDESVEDALEYLSAILIASMPIVTSKPELENWLKKFKARKK